uniref:DUF4806 domain-containing protein n=1 Tax=Anopheles farauti TaxID=69004 RepID=A0A182Q7F8_9DIPT
MDVEFEQVDDLHGLVEFDEKLGDAEYEEKIYQWLNSSIRELRSETRMTEAIDILFSKRLMAKCSWTGLGKQGEKIAMMKMVNIVKLFRRIGTTEYVALNPRMVMLFFMKKLKNAGKRVHLKNLRRSTAHSVASQRIKLEQLEKFD